MTDDARQSRGTYYEARIALALAKAGAFTPALARVRYVFVYRPGPTTDPPVYGDWGAMLAAMALVPGPKLLEVDTSVTSPAHVPAGTWSLDDVTIVVAPSAPSNQLVLDDGAHILATGWTINGLNLVQTGTTPAWEMPNNGLMLVQNASLIGGAPGAAPFAHLAAGGIAAAFRAFGSILGDGVNVFAQVDAGSFLGVALVNEAFLNGSATTGGGDLTITSSADSGVIPPQTVAIVNGPTPTAQAFLVSYNPASPANWSGVNPASVADALDRIAAKITPIP